MYSITMINRNGYTIARKFKTIKECKSFASYYPLAAFFCWIYNTASETMCYQNTYSNCWKRVNNETFTPYF